MEYISLSVLLSNMTSLTPKLTISETTLVGLWSNKNAYISPVETSA